MALERSQQMREESFMESVKSKTVLWLRGVLVASILSLGTQAVTGQETHSSYISPPGYIGGVVQSEHGPEAGVWVIAETKDLPTNFIKIVVTDDRGRFMVPELPGANYRVWVRGYGLVDSKPIEMKPSATAITLNVAAASSPQEAAKVYPGNYWLSLLEPPAA